MDAGGVAEDACKVSLRELEGRSLTVPRPAPSLHVVNGLPPPPGGKMTNPASVMRPAKDLPLPRPIPCPEAARLARCCLASPCLTEVSPLLARQSGDRIHCGSFEQSSVPLVQPHLVERHINLLAFG